MFVSANVVGVLTTAPDAAAPDVTARAYAWTATVVEPVSAAPLTSVVLALTVTVYGPASW